VNARNLWPANTAAAALFIGGVLVVLFPEAVASVARLVVVTIAATAGLYALAVNSPPAWGSPFLRGARRRGGGSAGEVAWIRARLAGWRLRAGPAPPMPREVLRMLRPLIVTALQRQGIDANDAADRTAARQLLSPLSWAVLTGDPGGRLAGLPTHPPDRRRVAEVVHRVLDDLDRLNPSHFRAP
jgi:hypothetical protein